MKNLDKYLSVLNEEVDVPKARKAYAEIGGDNSEQRADDICDKAEVEHLFPLEQKGDKIGIRRNVTKLERKSLDGKAHKIQRIVMEEQHKDHKETKHISVLIALESEYVVKGKGQHEGDAHPYQMIRAEP